MRTPTAWGIGTLAVAVVLAVVSAVLYVNPPQQKTVSFFTDDAASLQLGTTVRIAGVTVGKVKDMTIEPDQIRVDLRIDASAFVGDKSQVQVRMLTVVGGYYVTISSLGERPLGSQPIPVERVTMPYNLVRTMTDATRITDSVAAQPIKESLDRIQDGLRGDNTQALPALIKAGNALMSTIERQSGQVTEILGMSDEYLSALNGHAPVLQDIVRKASIAEQTLVLYGKGFAAVWTEMAEVAEGIQLVSTFYDNHRDDFLEKMRAWIEKGRLFFDRNGLTVRGLQRVQQRLNRILDAQDARPELLATDLCVPLPGSPCS
ncbi:MCE family protein [Mycolicibacterium neoaurum]|nr:MlaD family protein [Mycolicibacterium neoaurum]QVI30702.1 MCE family protein [Mycolicibacterium neoaurum]